MADEQMITRRFENPDEHRTFPLGSNDLIHVAGMTLGLARFEPGWRWSESVKPIVGTESCQVEHLGYVLQGRLRTRMDDGTEGEVSAGNVMYVAPGHDGWVVGDEPVLLLEIKGAEPYAKKA